MNDGPSRPDVVAHSGEVIRHGSKSFAAAARLFDPVTRDRAVMLYTWCRYCDDRIDGQTLGFGQASPPPAVQRRALESLRAQTNAAIDGHPGDSPEFAALGRVFSECDIPRRFALELLDGFEMDVDRRVYHTLDDTLEYCYHVAGTVGAMMAAVMGVKDQATLARAVDLGLAFQMTNIARDVMEDAADQRIYLPAEWLEDEGVPQDPEVLSQQTDRVFRVVSRLLDEADRYYESAVVGIARLPLRSAWAISAARSVYRAIGTLVRRRGRGAWDTRAHVGTAAKLRIIVASAARTLVLRAAPDKADERGDLWSPSA